MPDMFHVVLLQLHASSFVHVTALLELEHPVLIPRSGCISKSALPFITTIPLWLLLQFLGERSIFNLGGIPM